MAEETSPETNAAELESGGYTGLIANTYDVARQVCSAFTLRKLARDLDVPRTRAAVIAAYAELSKAGPHREASRDGCLAGLRERR